MKLLVTALAIANLILVAKSRGADVTTHHALTMDVAKKVAEAAAAYAKENGAAGNIAIVDEGGHLLYFMRLDGSFAAGANVSIGKARTSATFKKPTKDFEDIINKGRFTMTALPDFTPHHNMTAASLRIVSATENEAKAGLVPELSST